MKPIATLHILNKAPEHSRSVECMRSLRAGDALLLTESAVLAIATTDVHDPNTTVYALKADVLARGLDDCASETHLVDFPAMVDLTAQAQNIISW
ncbi:MULTISPECIES: sulfurtransferase complex subunit TusB [unclassified Marinobacter]|uniref:sulfurtransferase complex subunit TusB n=1 Tax=unclassified Marinobacter TaxID=83889 RepID=UPI0026E40D82|nr:MULTISPECIES: sulfurtransferase complex subunit TusB [unclassified Marinobacter]MDO6442412.1 sulfurtransferase complex subunit TusB [Marinobacter sp. 2_MG-2023]MDO6824468.1 sulfurtransferase complex subunit TusB [Marinobacter sp. 1_MG-2023]